MATTFEVVIAGETAEYARQAAAAAFGEISRVEQVLSRFLEHSDVSRINRLAPGESTRIGVEAFECLELAATIHADTAGAFDATVGPLVTLWQGARARGDTPSEEALAEARARVGMDLLELDAREYRVRVKVQGVQVDLGGIGKGYALDLASEMLRDWSIEAALVSAGESTVLALGLPEGERGWSVGVGGVANKPPEKSCLCNRALSGSGIAIKGPHIIDPRTGKPAQGNTAAWAACPSAAAADALSTAFMVMSSAEVEQYCRERPDTAAMLAVVQDGREKLLRFGDWGAGNAA